MAVENALLLSLFEWLNSLREDKVQSLDDISSGSSLWDLLREIDPDAFTDELPRTVACEDPSEAWTDSLENLKYIYAALTAYVVDRCRRKLPLPGGDPDLQAIAQGTSESDAIQLLKLVFLAAIFGRFSMDYIQKLTSFPEEHQNQFYLILEETEALEEEAKVPASPSSPAHGNDRAPEDRSSSINVQGRDHGLVYEERLAELVAVNKGLHTETMELKEQLENLHDLHTKLQKSYDKLDVAHKDTSERLNALRSGRGEQSMISIQRTKMEQQETVIATFEGKVAALQHERDGFKTESEVLKSQLEDFHQMQDDMFELRHDRESLERKANTADKYKQKLQGLQKVEEENEGLKYRVSELQRQLKQSDSDHVHQSDLRHENDEFRRLVSNIEQELSQSIEAKKRAEYEKMTLEAKMQAADGQATKWQAKAESLQKTLLERSGPESPATPRPTATQSFSPATGDSDATQVEDDTAKAGRTSPVEEQNYITEQELQSILSAMKAHTRSIPSDQASSIQEQQKLAAKLEQSTANAKEVKQQNISQSSLIASLRAELDSATDGNQAALPRRASSAAAEAGQSPDVDFHARLESALSQKANLERELQLMASAWYDLNARVVSSNVGGFGSRGRGRPDPKSFLGRQRRLVDGLLTGRS